MRFLPAFVMLIIVFASCLNNGKDKEALWNPDSIFHDYKISGEEGREEVTIVLQHRIGGLEEETIFLQDSKISLDGIELKPDSAKLTGTFYEVQRSAEEFKGKHTIRFTDNRDKEYRVEFTYQPFTLAEEMSEQVAKKPFQIRLKDFPAGPATVQLVMVDTSFESKDVNEEVIVRDGELAITQKQLSNLSNGPVSLELHYEKEMPLKNFSSTGGRILMTYSLRRQFEFIP